MSAASSMLVPGHSMPRLEQYQHAWALLLHTPRVDSHDLAQAKCWLTHRAVDGEVPLADWVRLILPVHPIQQTDALRVRWTVSQAAAELHLWIQRGQSTDLTHAWQAAEVVNGLTDELTLHPPSIQNWITAQFLRGFHHWTQHRDDEARRILTAAVLQWQQIMGALDWTRWPLRIPESHGDLEILSSILFLLGNLGAIGMPEVPWISAGKVLDGCATQPWVRSLRALQTPTHRMEPEHRHAEDYRKIHTSNPAYGPGPSKADLATMGLLTRGFDVKRALDYGAGRSTALDTLWPNAERVRYDFAIPGLDVLPTGRYDMGISTDVFEHIPESELDAALRCLAAWSDRWCVIIYTGPAKQLLPDGKNAHVTQRSHAWWLARFRQFFPQVTPWQPLDPKRVGLVTWTA